MQSNFPACLYGLTCKEPGNFYILNVWIKDIFEEVVDTNQALQHQVKSGGLTKMEGLKSKIK